MEFRQVVLASVANDKYYDGVLIEIARHAQSGSAVGAGGAAAKDSLDAAQLTARFKRITVSDIDYFVDVLHVRITRQHFLADSFNQIGRRLRDLAGFFVGFVNRPNRISADNFDVRILLFEKLARAGDGSTGANPGNEVRDLAFSLLPKLRAGGAVVGFRVGRM